MPGVMTSTGLGVRKPPRPGRNLPGSRGRGAVPLILVVRPRDRGGRPNDVAFGPRRADTGLDVALVPLLSARYGCSR